MLTSRPRDRGMMTIECPEGVLIPRPTTGAFRAKWQRFLNWPRDENGAPVPDYPGGPKGEKKVCQVPCDAYWMRKVIKGEIKRVKDAPPKADPPKKDKK